MRVCLVVGAVCLMGCGGPEEAAALDGPAEVAQSREALKTFYIGTDVGFGEGPAMPATDSSKGPYGRHPTNWRIIRYNAWGWAYPEGLTTELIIGRPSPVRRPVDGCNMVFARRSGGGIGFLAENNWGEFGCGSDNVNLTPIPSVLPGDSHGSPSASGWYSGGVARYDVFAPQYFSGTVKSHIVQATGTSTGDTVAPSWTSWTTDTSLTLMPGTSPAAVSATAGRIDLFACDSTGNLRWKTFTGTSWSAWSTASTCAGSPAVTGYQGTTLPGYAVPTLVVAVKQAGNTLKAGRWSSGPFFTGWYWETLSTATTYETPSVRYRWGTGAYEVWTRSTVDGLGWFAEF